MASVERTCPQCGALLPGTTPAWLCPRCLLGHAAQTLAPAEVASPAGSPGRQPTSSVIHYFGDFELLEEIARGGVGVVYKARQISLNRIVAVKMLQFGRLANDEFKKRFRVEAEAAASLQHPNIVAIHEVGEHEGQQYFSMDYVEGGNLADLVREKPLPALRAAAYLKTIAQAIHCAHQRGILHRDLKPANVLIDAHGEPRVTDFGLAKRIVAQAGILGCAEDLTLTGHVLGTPHYMPPEQADGKRRDVTPASDVYSLGAILYHLITGRPPFLAESLEATLAQMLQSEPISPRLLNASVARDLETICLKCLSKEPGKRYCSAQELSDELGHFLHGEPIRAHPISSHEKLWRWCRRKPALAASIAIICLVGALGLAGILWQWRRAERNAVRETAQRLRAEEAVTMLELQRAEDLLEKDEVLMGVAYLARIVRQQPSNLVASRRLLSALTMRNFALPVGPPLQHGKKVNYAEFSPDGRRVVTASLDFTARLWDARTGEPVTSPLLHQQAVRFAQFSPDGGRVLTFTDDFRAHLWDATTGGRLGQPMAHTKKIWTAQFSPGGTRVLTASDDGTARIWNALTGEPLLEPLLHQAAVRSARFSPEGRHIVTASADKTAQLWDALTGRPARPPLQHGSRVIGAEFSPDGRWVVTVAEDSSTCVWDVASGEPLAKPLVHPEPIVKAKFSPDVERIVTVPDWGEARIWRARDWAPLAGPIQGGFPATVEFGPEAQRLLFGPIENAARLWDVNNAEPLTTPMQHEGLVWSARLSRDGLFAVTASADATAQIWDVRLGSARSQPMQHAAPVQAANFSPDGERVVTGSHDHTALLWDLLTGQPKGPALAHGWGVFQIQFSPDGQRVATCAGDQARIWDAFTASPVTEPLRHDDVVRYLEFSPDSQWLATASDDKTVRFWNALTGEPRGSPIHHRAPVHLVRYSPDGQRVLSADLLEDSAQIHEVTTGRLVVQTPAREGTVLDADFSADGGRFATASEDGTARIWNAYTGQLIAGPLRHKARVMEVRFSSDGNRVVTASRDGTAQIWGAQNGQPLGEPLRHQSDVNTAEFDPKGDLVVTASRDGTARLWDARTGRPVAEPFRHGNKVQGRALIREESMSAHFSPDSRRVVTASYSDAAHVWEVPPCAHDSPSRLTSLPSGQDVHSLSERAQNRAPSAGTIQGEDLPSANLLLADLAEAVIGKRVNEQGAFESVSTARLGPLRQRVARLPRGTDFTRWLEWFFADRSTRIISPYSPVTMPEYVRSLATRTNETSWREALMLCPTNGLAFTQLARYHLAQSRTSDSPDARQAEWASRQALKFAPGEERTWRSLMQVAEHTGAWTNLLADVEQALLLDPGNPHLDAIGRFEIDGIAAGAIEAGRQQLHVSGAFPDPTRIKIYVPEPGVVGQVVFNGALVEARIEDATRSSMRISIPAQLPGSSCILTLGHFDGKSITPDRVSNGCWVDIPREHGR